MSEKQSSKDKKDETCCQTSSGTSSTGIIAAKSWFKSRRQIAESPIVTVTGSVGAKTSSYYRMRTQVFLMSRIFCI